MVASDWDTALQRLADETGPTGFEGFDGELLSAQRTPSLTPTSASDSGTGDGGIDAVTPLPDDSMGMGDGMEDVEVAVLPSLQDHAVVDDGMDWD